MSGSKVEFLVSCMEKDALSLTERMNIPCDSLVVNQAGLYGYEEHRTSHGIVRCFACDERGVGRSRNTAILHARGEIVVFADEDIVYNEDAESLIKEEFESHPDADMLLFDFHYIDDSGSRALPAPIVSEIRLNSVKYMQYGAARIAVRLDSLLSKDLLFSLQFGGGAAYSCGEDTVFLHDCIKAGLVCIAVPVVIGELHFGVSSWFSGYDEKFFYDRGVLNRRVAGHLHWAVSLRYLFRHMDVAKSELGVLRAFALLLDGGQVKTC